ncbi:hypothetical protein GGI20_002415 [Coemansia sp. BCRC 34301]|nr:hypothetical protein GGI20_002415 [Coemansia sp. BCRC 34301]
MKLTATIVTFCVIAIASVHALPATPRKHLTPYQKCVAEHGGEHFPYPGPGDCHNIGSCECLPDGTVAGFRTMDDLLQTVKLEVTLDCMEGSSLSKVWSYVELAQRRLLQRNGLDPESASVDVSIKRYLWPHILTLSGMTFVNEGSVIYDPAATIDSGAPSDFSLLSADEVESRFPDLVVRASPSAIYKEIFGREEGNERLLKSTYAFKLIQELSRSREKGVTQIKLSRTFSLDPRSTFHFIKIIDREGLIAKYSTYECGNTTNLWVLRRFVADRQDAAGNASGLVGRTNVPAPDPSNSGESLTAFFVSNEMRKQVSDILEAPGAGYMIDTDLMDLLKLDIWSTRHRKYFQRVIRYLTDNGYVEQVELQIPDAAALPVAPPGVEPMDVDTAEAPESTNSEKAKKARREIQLLRTQKERAERGLREGHSFRRCLRSIKPYVAKTKTRTRFGVPLVQSAEERPARAADAVQDDDGGGGLSDAAMAESDVADNEDGVDSSSDDDELDVEALKEKDDLRYMLSKHSVQVGSLAMLPPEAQVLRLIALSGSHGIVARAIQHLLKWTSNKPISRCLNRLEQTPVFLSDGSWPGVYTPEELKQENIKHLGEMLVEAVEEFMGREHRKRYFVNTRATMATASLTAYVDVVAAQQPTLRLESALATLSSVATAAVAAPDIGSSQSVHRVSPQPDSAAVPLETEQLKTQLATPEPMSTPAAESTPTAEEEAEAAESALVLADMAEYTNFDDIYAEAKNRKVPLNNVIREHVILGMLRQEAVFTCSLEYVMRCDRTVKKYVKANMDSPAMTPTLAKTILGHVMDKRTFHRSIMSLSDQQRIWYQTLDSLPDIPGPNANARVHLAIARDTDPNGPIISAYISQLRDIRRYNKQSTATKTRRITEPIPVKRTEGAEERDRDFLVRKMDTEESRAQGTKNYSLRTRYGKRYGDLSSSTMPRNEDGNIIIKRARVTLIDKPGAPSQELTEWQAVEKRLHYIPRRIGRIKDLYEYLVHNLADSVDNDTVFGNCGFRSSFLFYRLPLELFLEITGGIVYFQDLVPYIRDGTCTRVDGRTRSSTNEAEISDTQREQENSLEKVNARLATPLYMLPQTIIQMIDKRIVRTRTHIQSLIYALYILQLIRPIENVREIMSLPSPPDAKDAFASEPARSPKILGFGYQLIGKARLLNREGYNLALDAYQAMSKQRLDLTTCYLDQNVYSMLDQADAFKYWSDLQQTASTEAKDLRLPHLLFGLGKPYFWVLDISLDGKQTKALNSFVDKRGMHTPLANPDLLVDASKKAGTSLEETRRYFQHKQSEMAKRSSDFRARLQGRKEFVMKRVQRARAAETKKRDELKSTEERGGGDELKSTEERGGGDELKSTEEHGGGAKFKRTRWSEEDSMRVAVYYAVTQHHARTHGLMFMLHRVGNIFPNCRNDTPYESARHHWCHLKKNEELSFMVKKVNAVWRYAFLDALKAGDLVDDSDPNSFNFRGAFDYYCDLIKRETLDGLVSRYSDDMAKDDLGLDSLDLVVTRHGRRVRSRKARAKRGDNADATDVDTEAEDAAENENRVYRLPATLLGKRALYNIDKGGKQFFSFAEDTMRESAMGRTRLMNGRNAMFTTHAGWECAMDYGSPCTVLLSSRGKLAESDQMDVDGEASAPEPTPADVTVVSHGMSRFAYATALQRYCRVERTFDADSLARRIGELALGGDDDSEGERAPTAEIGDPVKSQRYAEIASLQAMITNLAITPANEYDVETGYRLLQAKETMADEAYRLTLRHIVVAELDGMSASTGLGVQPPASAPDSTEPHGGALESLVSALKSTAVTYETTGMMRISARPVDVKPVIERPDTNGASDADDEGGAAEADPGDDAKTFASRNVPGRGCGPSDKLLSTIRATRPGRFASPRGVFGETGSALSEYLAPADFERLCWLLGQGQLWLRPVYKRKPSESRLSALSGFKKRNSAGPADYKLKVAYIGHAAEFEVERDLVDKTYQLSTSTSGAKARLPAGDSLAVASRIAVGVVHEMGALGASEHELFALLTLLLAPSMHATTAAALPNDARLVLTTRSQLSALLRLLALEGKLHVVGNHDLRYVSKDAYCKYWSLRLEGIEHTFEPYVGQNMSGSVNTAYTLGMLTALVSHIVDNPGITQVMLARRFYAPIISTKEVLSYLGQLVDMGIVVAETIEAPSPLNLMWPGVGTTHYSMAPDYRHRILLLKDCWAASRLNKI